MSVVARGRHARKQTEGPCLATGTRFWVLASCPRQTGSERFGNIRGKHSFLKATGGSAFQREFVCLSWQRLWSPRSPVVCRRHRQMCSGIAKGSGKNMIRSCLGFELRLPYGRKAKQSNARRGWR